MNYFPMKTNEKYPLPHNNPHHICTYIQLNAMAHTKNSNSYNCFENQLPFYKEFSLNIIKIIKQQVHLRISFLNRSRMKPATLSSDAIHCMSMSRLMEIFLERDYNNDKQNEALLVL
jgi:hypothetical protein